MAKICVFGAGAIGGYLAVELACAGNDVRVIARGAHLQAIKSSGLTLRIGGAERCARVAASDDPADFGPQDFVICALKAHQAHRHAASFAPLLGPRTAIVTAMNGIPWWYFHNNGGPFDGRPMETVDPGARQWTLLGPERAIGCVVDCACELVAPGIVEHREFNRITLGEPDGASSERVRALGAILAAANFDVPIRDEIRWNIWVKLAGNVCFNPISVLTGATVGRIATEPALRALSRRMMLEAAAVAAALGVVVEERTLDRRLDNASRVAGHKPSMLQDFERGRELEIDALVTAVAELGRLTGTPTPVIDMVLGLVQERAEQAGLYRRPAAASAGR